LRDIHEITAFRDRLRNRIAEHKPIRTPAVNGASRARLLFRCATFAQPIAAPGMLMRLWLAEAHIDAYQPPPERIRLVLLGERGWEALQGMDPHFWPSTYPGLIVGILYGLSLRGVFNTIVSALGGLIGAAIAYEILTAVDMNDGLPGVIGLILVAFVGAYLLTSLTRRILGLTPKS
jgi:uncharacterized membrane protein YeaQ/YmgE (transglycosylase-associated protein family)